jgi:hypothetical protein
MAVEPQNLIQVQSRLQDPTVRNEDLLKFANGSNPEVPSFLALIEMNRRKQIATNADAFNQSNKDSIKNQVASALTQPAPSINMSANPFTKNLTNAAPGVNMSGNPATADITQGIAGINPAALPPQPVMDQNQPIAAAEGGLMSIPVGHFNEQSYAGGGIVAFGNPELNPDEKQLVADKTVGGMTLDKVISTARERNAQSNIPFTKDDESVIRRRFDGAEADPTKTDTTKPSAISSSPQPKATGATGLGGYQAILAGLPSLQAPAEKTNEQLFAEKKARDKMAGVADDPFADVKKREADREARQAQNYEQFGSDRLLAQMAAFATADPAKGFGYAGAVSAKASAELNKEQNALRDKEEAAQIEFARAIAKEEDARRRNDSDGVAAAQKDQQEAKFKFQKAEYDRGALAAQIYSVQETSKYHDKMAGKPTREQFMADLAKTDPELFRMMQGQGKAGVLTFEEALKIVNADKLNTGKSVDEKIRLAQEMLDAQERLKNTKDAKKPGSEAPNVADDRPWYQRMLSPSQPTNKTVSFNDLPK